MKGCENMALSEFRYNLKSKHYAYIYGSKGLYRKNITISTKPYYKEKLKNGSYKYHKNIRLYKHPNSNSNKEVYLIPKRKLTHKDKFYKRKLKWKFHIFDKRKVKRIIKNK